MSQLRNHGAFLDTNLGWQRETNLKELLIATRLPPQKGVPVKCGLLRRARPELLYRINVAVLPPLPLCLKAS